VTLKVHRLCFAKAVLASVAVVVLPASAAAQAFTSPQGVGAVTLMWQLVDNTGHRLSDGTLRVAGESVTTSAVVDMEYGVTDRLSASVGVPYVFAKYTGGMPPPSGLAVDTCACWHSSLQDLSLAARYRFGNQRWAVTPTLKYGGPTHDYAHAGEAVVGTNLRELQVGAAAGMRLVSLLPKASLQTGYTYSWVEKPLPTVPIDRSNAFVDFGYALARTLYIRGDATWQRTNGGLRLGSFTGDPFLPPGEYNTPALFAERDRLGRVNYWHVGAGASFSAGPVDLFLSVTKYVSGTDTHNGVAVSVGSTWYFDVSKKTRVSPSSR
jgi:hypothetical protein